ncbi:hypothetical protein Tco_0150137 [Tanacetum coccineum]
MDLFVLTTVRSINHKTYCLVVTDDYNPLGKFDEKADEGFFVGYSINRNGPDWLFDIDLLTKSMNYEPITAGNQTNKNVEDAVADDAGKKTNEEPANEGERNGQEKKGGASNKEDDQNVKIFRAKLDNLLNTTDLLNTGIFSGAYNDEDVGAEANLNNLETTMNCYTQEEGIDYDDVFAPVARIEEIRLQVKQKDDGIFYQQEIKYVAVLYVGSFDFVTMKTSSTPIETNKALIKDEEAEDVDVHLYRLMIGSLMYLAASRPDIIFVVCACAWFQVTPKFSHLHAVKWIFRYLKVNQLEPLVSSGFTI